MAKFKAQSLAQTQPQNCHLKGPEPCLDSAPKLPNLRPKALPRFSAKIVKSELPKKESNLERGRLKGGCHKTRLERGAPAV